MSALLVTGGRTTTLQDGGRLGHARLGVPRSGPMDATSHRLAAMLSGVGRDQVASCATLEIGPGGARLTAGANPVLLAIASPDARCTPHAGQPEPVTASVRRLPAGASLHVGPGPEAAWVYVAAVGGFAVPPVLGSRAQHPRSGLGPAAAEPWELPIGPAPTAVPPLGDRRWRHPGTGPFGLMPGPQTHLFAADVLERLVSSAFRTTTRFDRMGHRLDGPALPAMSGHDIVSDGVVVGALQVPGDGRAFVLSADHQTTGGYPKIAVMARADLDRFVQLPSGRELRFRWIDGDEARARLRAARTAADRLLATSPSPGGASLAELNLIDGVTEG